MLVGINEVTKAKVAVKIISKDKFKNNHILEKLQREIKILKRFNHPHLIKLYEYIPTSKEIYVIEEYAQGGELFDLITKREKVSKLDALYESTTSFNKMILSLRIPDSITRR